MAEKKFFVDINLQGSALTNAKIGTNSGIGSTEGAFGYDSASHRLQYFNGTATKNVANLSDISAVTGGLIFQGGYDPTTDTPDITDGTALKGFFWAATAAGTFLGESVQVGDSIVAKVDAAGATIADWLILQGNIVIATDSVDGISRLATQTEANDGTEGGAVVITPATLQGKIDAQITPEISSKVSKSGDTMSGNLNLGNNDITGVATLSTGRVDTNFLANRDNPGGAPITSFDSIDFADAEGGTIINLPAPTNGGDAANKDYVDNNTSNKLPLAGGTMSGSIFMDNAGSVEGAINLSGQYLVVNEIQGLTDSEIIVSGQFNMDAHPITNLPAPTDGGDATNKTYVDGQVATSLPLAGGTMSGNIDMNNNQLERVTAICPNNENELLIGTDVTLNGFKINGLGTPTSGANATNKDYVDGAASTAQANAEATASADATTKADAAEAAANAYTDTEIAAQSHGEKIDLEDWTGTAGNYSYVFANPLDTTFLTMSAFESGTGEYIEVGYANSGGNITISINNLPTDTLYISLVKANFVA